jgi:hypothetical protein
MTKTNITGTQLVGSGLGLTPQTAALQDCKESIEFISENRITLEEVNGRVALIGDGSEESRMIGYFFQESMKDGILLNLSPIARLAHIINRLASNLDVQEPCGTPSRMQMLWMFQHSKEIER